MVQLVICAKDKVNADDVVADTHLPKRGDVISVFDDTLDLTLFPAVTQNPEWLIVHLPNGTLKDVAPLLEMERDPNPAAKLDQRLASKTLQYRARSIAIAGLGLNEAAIKATKLNAAQGKAPAPGVDAAVATANVLAVVVNKTAIADPTVIGKAPPAIDPLVIGAA